MPTEEQIKELAYAMWEQEGRPDGKDQEHYYRARQILEEKEKPPLVQLTTAPSGMRLTAPPPTPDNVIQLEFPFPPAADAATRQLAGRR